MSCSSKLVSLFADDSCLSVIVETPLRAANMLYHDLENISNWANQWLVSFNSQKTDDMVISRKIGKPQHPGLLFNDAEITRVDTHKHLGLILSSSLSWSPHIQEISTMACKILNVMHAIADHACTAHERSLNYDTCHEFIRVYLWMIYVYV